MIVNQHHPLQPKAFLELCYLIDNHRRVFRAAWAEESKLREKAQSNSNDPDPRIITDKTINGFRQCHSYQSIVDVHVQVIVPVRVSLKINDSQELIQICALIRPKTDL